MATEHSVTRHWDVREIARRGWEFLNYLRRRFESDQCTRAAASLSYTSLLALVPLFTVLFVTLSAFPAFQEWRADIEAFLFKNFVPALGDQIRDYLLQFADKAKGLQAAGIAVLFLTVLAMMSTIESTFNVIWGIRRKRPLVVRFLVYWAVLTLGPLFIGAGMVATSYVISLPLLSDAGVTVGLKTRLIGAFPVIATTFAFVLFFKLIPYRPVPFRHALIGGVVASVLFELAKCGFAFYVTHFPAQQAVYGAFATVPIFLIWIYLSSVVVLLGAEITQCLTTFQAAVPHAAKGVRDPLYCAYRVLYRMFAAQHAGRALSDKALLRAEPELGYDAINAALECLDQGGWISRNDDFQWVLLRDMHRMRLLDLMRLVPSLIRNENVEALNTEAADANLFDMLGQHTRWIEAELAIPIADLMLSSDADDEGRRGKRASA